MNPHRDIEEEVAVFDEEEVRRRDEEYVKAHPELFHLVCQRAWRISVLHLLGDRRGEGADTFLEKRVDSPFLYEEGYVEFLDDNDPHVVFTGRWPNYDDDDYEFPMSWTKRFK